MPRRRLSRIQVDISPFEFLMNNIDYFIDPQLMTIATLTGHAVLAVGGYSTIMDNGPARAAGTALQVQEAGDKVGDMFEISTVRREDWDFVKDKSGEFVSILQCNNAASSRTPRGHQFPAAFSSPQQFLAVLNAWPLSGHVAGSPAAVGRRLRYPAGRSPDRVGSP